MAIARHRVDPIFGDALAGDGGMTDSVSTGPRRNLSFDVFPDALSALPLPALTLVGPPTGDDVAVGAAPTAAVPRAPAPGRTPAPGRPGAPPVRSRPPTGPVWSGYPPPGQAVAGQPAPIPAAAAYSRPATLPRRAQVPAAQARGVLAPSSGRRPVAGIGYTTPPTTTGGVVRPPAYLPQNQGLAQLRAAVQQARGTVRPPASQPSAVRPASPSTGRPGPPSAVRPAPSTGARRKGRFSGAWALVVFVVLFLVSSGAGQQIMNALSQLLHHR